MREQVQLDILASYQRKAWQSSIERHMQEAGDDRIRGITVREHLRGNLLMLVVADYQSQYIGTRMYNRLIRQLNAALVNAGIPTFEEEDIDAIRRMQTPASEG